LVDIKEKLKRLKVKIKHWNMVDTSNTKSLKRQLVAHIEELDKCDDEETLNDDMRVKRVDVLRQLRSLEDKEVAMLKQKSRIEWLKSGDTNTKFFHSRLRWRRAKNDIVELCINNTWYDEVSSVKDQVKQYFESRFTTKSEIKLNLDGVRFKSITEANNVQLCSDITELEVLDVVSQCGSSKCPGLDGFNFFFVKNN